MEMRATLDDHFRKDVQSTETFTINEEWNFSLLFYRFDWILIRKALCSPSLAKMNVGSSLRTIRPGSAG